ncbi:MAG TPA: hypothetical protein VGB00_01980 [Pyrinomonadaceae bacterium]
MKRFLIYAVLIFACAFPAQAQSRSNNKQIKRIAENVSGTPDLSVLDRLRLIRGNLKIVIEHSISEPTFEVRHFRSFRAAERWLTSREQPRGFPRRTALPFSGCRKGICTFGSDGGILHNQLYIKKILYGYRKKRPYIKAVYFLDGD